MCVIALNTQNLASRGGGSQGAPYPPVSPYHPFPGGGSSVKVSLTTLKKSSNLFIFFWYCKSFSKLNFSSPYKQTLLKRHNITLLLLKKLYPGKLQKWVTRCQQLHRFVCTIIIMTITKISLSNRIAFFSHFIFFSIRTCPYNL